MCDRLPQSLEVDIKMQEKENEEEEEDPKDGSRSKGGPKNKKAKCPRKNTGVSTGGGTEQEGGVWNV